MDMITVSAKTLDEAITKALIELGTTSDNLDYTIVEKGSAGLLGFIGAKPVVISAKKKRELDTLDDFLDKDQEIKKQQEAARKEAKAAQKAAKSVEKEAKFVKEEKPAKEEKPMKPARENKPAKEDRNVKEEKAAKEDKTLKEHKAVKEEGRDKPVAASKKSVDGAVYEESAKKFLTQMFAAMNMEVEITASYHEGDKELYVDMSGADMGILIGKRGQTLDSLQYLVSLVVNKDCEGYVRVKLDTENYRARRKDTLEILAKNIAYKVKRTRRSVSLEPMNPYERRIIHSALQNDKFVITRSEGEEPFRHVVVSLKRDNRENKENRDRNN